MTYGGGASPSDAWAQAMQAPKGGGTAAPLGGTTSWSEVLGVAVNATHATWFESPYVDEQWHRGPSKLVRVPLAGGPAEVTDLGTVALTAPISCPGGVCWRAYDPALPYATQTQLLRYNHCP